MRFVDLAVAALIGGAAITGIVAWSPAAGDDGARRLSAQVQLRDRLLSSLDQKGIAPLLEPPPAACRHLAEMSNQTFRLYATIGGYPCGAPPQRGSPSAALSLRLDSTEVVLVAWQPA